MMKGNIEILYGDIWEASVDAIVCQANTDLEAEDSITTKLIEVGGDDIQAECNDIENAEVGQAVATNAGKLPVKKLIHAMVYNVGEIITEESIMAAVRQSLLLTKELSLTSVAMPLLSGDNSDIPVKRAAELILAEVKRHLEGDTSLEKVLFVLNDETSYEAFEEGSRQI